MNTITILGIIIALLLTIICYIATSNIYISLVVLLLSILYFMLIATRLIKKNHEKVERYHQCYHFINTFVISLSVKQSLKGAFSSTFESMDTAFKNEMTGLEEMDEIEKLSYLSSYFKFHNYHLFCDLINLWVEQGGNILEMSAHLINESRLTEEYLIQCDRLAKKHLFEFALLWFIALAILVVLRFALAQFYNQIIKQMFYPVAVLIIILLCLGTIHLTILRMNKVEIRGWDDVK